MFYNYQGLTMDSKEASKEFNEVMALLTPSMGEVELICEEDAQFSQLYKLLERLTGKDTILVYSIARFGINRANALNILCKLMDKRVGVTSIVDGQINPNFVDFVLTGAVEVKSKRSTFSQLMREVP